MAKSKETFRNPFLEFDLNKMFGDLRVPGVQVDTLLESQRRNFEAVAEANRITIEGVQAIAQRQAEILRESLEESSKLVEKMSGDQTPEQRAARQLEVMKNAMETALANMRELSEMATKSSNDALDTINARVTQSLDELRQAVAK